jgi:spore coat protein CotF
MNVKAIVLCALVLTMAPVYAQEAGLPDPGVKPDSILYGLDRAIERIELALARGHANKAEVHLNHAQERLAEVKALVEENKIEDVEDTLEDYQEEMEEASNEINEAQGIGQNVSALVKEINESIDKHVAILQLVVDKVPEQAKEAIQRNIDRAIANNERHRVKIAAREERKQGFEIGNKSEGVPPYTKDKSNHTGKPEDVGKPEEKGKPETAGQSEGVGKPDETGKPDGVGKLG